LSKIETVCEAIATHRLLQICYQDHYRIVEPNAYASDGKGSAVLLAWQLEGGGGRDNGRGWRLLPISAMEKVTLLEDSFAGPRPHPHHDSSSLTVYARA
jgi:hypothetical protein